MVEISIAKGYLYYCFSFFLFIYSNNCNHGISPSDISLNEVHTIKYRSWIVPLLFLSKEVSKIGMINPSTKSVITKIWVMCTFKLIEDMTQKLTFACKLWKINGLWMSCHISIKIMITLKKSLCLHAFILRFPF